MNSGTLVLCDKCMEGGSYQFDFNQRCCRARQVAGMPRHLRQAKYRRVEELYGKEAVERLLADVKVLAVHLRRLGGKESSRSNEDCVPTSERGNDRKK